MSRQKWTPKEARQHAEKMGNEYRRTKAYSRDDVCSQWREVQPGTIAVCGETGGHRGWCLSDDGWSWDAGDDTSTPVLFPRTETP